MDNKNSIIKNAKPINNRIIGVYFLIDSGTIVYVGSSTNCESRIQSHMNDTKRIFNSYHIIETPIEELEQKEAEYIMEYLPKYNKAVPKNVFFKRIIKLEGENNDTKMNLECVIFNNNLYIKNFPYDVKQVRI